MDDSLPAGNGIAALVLLRLGHLLGERRYLDAAESCLLAGWAAVSELPYAHNAMLHALEEYLNPPATVILRGDPAAMQEWQQQLASDYRPSCQLFCIDQYADALPAAIADKQASQQPVTAYVCRDFTCSEPVHDLSALQALL
jgi:hypothetical protein